MDIYGVKRGHPPQKNMETAREKASLLGETKGFWKGELSKL